MKVIRETIGDASVTIQVIDDYLEVLGEESGRATQLTGVRRKADNVYAQVKNLMREVSVDVGKEIRKIEVRLRPQKVEIELKIGFSSQVGLIWLMGGQSDYGMKVKMTWETRKSNNVQDT